MERASLRLCMAIALVSAGALAYQLLLMRWLAIAHWHPFAVMIISLALLGHGASGTWLGLWPDATRRAFARLFPLSAAAFGLLAVVALLLARSVPFNGLELVWNPQQLLWLSLLYLLLATPFFFAASCFGLAFARYGEEIPMLYGADLLGAGVGALVAAGLVLLPLDRALPTAAACGVLAAALMLRPERAHGPVVVVVIAAAAVVAWAASTRALMPPVNAFKAQAKTLLLGDARVLAQDYGPYGWLTVVASPRVPFRHAPGLSLANTQEPPPQLAIFVDGDGLAAIAHDRGRSDDFAYLQRMTAALPYRLTTAPRVLVLGMGGGQDVRQALQMGARAVDAVEFNPQRARAVCVQFQRYAGQLCRDPRVRVQVAEPRAYARAQRQRYDVVVLASGESFAGGGAGVQAAAEQYALTVEALSDYLHALAPGGLLAMTRYSKQPPRDELKLWATAVAALQRRGTRAPQRHLLAISNWDASTTVIAIAPFDAAQLAAVREFAEAWSFDPVFQPGLRAAEVNRYHVVERAYFAEGARALLAPNAKAYLHHYKFAIAPATDDRPYFGNFFRWRSLPELWRLRGEGGAVLLDSGYLLLLGALVQALPVAVVLVVVPLWLRRRRSDVASPGTRLRMAGYFIALGLAFLFIEIASLSRLTLLVGHPLIAATTGLAGFLLFAGLGSVWAQRWLRSAAANPHDDAPLVRAVTWAVVAIALGLLWQLAVFAGVMRYGAAWPVSVRAFAGLLGIAPLAFAMGVPFPLGLARIARVAPGWVAWAWGLNGFASVIAAIAALLWAMAIGLRATLLTALAWYVVAAWVLRLDQYRSIGSTSSDQRTRRASGAA